MNHFYCGEKLDKNYTNIAYVYHYSEVE